MKTISVALDQGNKVIGAAYQIYDESKDDYDKEELIDTLEKYLSLQKAK